MKWFWKKMWLGLLEALEQWLKTKQAPQNSPPVEIVKPTPVLPDSQSSNQDVTTRTVGKQAHEILRGRR